MWGILARVTHTHRMQPYPQYLDIPRLTQAGESERKTSLHAVNGQALWARIQTPAVAGKIHCVPQLHWSPTPPLQTPHP